MPQDSIKTIKSKAVLEMLTVAHEFCLFIESSENYDKETIIGYLQKVCPLIYLKGALLPEVKVSDEAAAERFVFSKIMYCSFFVIILSIMSRVLKINFKLSATILSFKISFDTRFCALVI